MNKQKIDYNSLQYYVFFGLSKKQSTINYLEKLGEALERNYSAGNNIVCDSPMEYVETVMNSMGMELPCSMKNILAHVAYFDDEGKKCYVRDEHALDEHDREQKHRLGQAVARSLRHGNYVNPRYYEYMNWQ